MIKTALLLVSVTLLTPMIHEIPLSALAALLITLKEDLLMGVLSGILFKPILDFSKKYRTA